LRVFISQKDLIGIYSGVQRKVHEEIQYFAGRGDTVFVCAERINKEAVIKSGGVPVKTFRWPFSGYKRRLNYLKLAQKKILKLKPEIVIGHGDIVEQDLCYIHNCVHLAHELIHDRPMEATHEVGKIHTQILKTQHFKRLICNSKLMQLDLTKRFNIPMEKTQVIYPEYNPDKFKPDKFKNVDHTLRASTRAELGFIDGEVVIGLITSGNFKKRNVSRFLKACEQIKKPFKILIVGKDDFSPYEAQIKDTALEQRVIYGKSRSDVEAYYHAVDIFILPALIEEFGRSVLEAMGCAKPVIVSEKVGSSEILEASSRDYIIDPTSLEDIKLKIETLLNHPEKFEELGTLNYQTAQKYTAAEQAKKFDALIKSLLAGEL